MPRRAIASLVACGLMSLVLIYDLPTEMAAADKAGQPYSRPIRNPKFIPTANQVELFEAVDAGQIAVRLIPKNAMGGNVLIENKTDKPLTVKIPEAVAGVSIHAQFGNFGAGNQAIGNQGAGNAGAGNGQQAVAGGLNMFQGNGQNQGLGNGQGQGQGQNINGFFSIPAEKTISLQLNSVCLEHGKPEPTSGSKYTLVPVSRISRDPVLFQLLAIVGTGKVDPKAAQAATWHLANKMSFQELAEKVNTPLGALTSTPDFSRDQILAAQGLVAEAIKQEEELNTANSAEPKSDKVTTPTKPVRLATN